MQRLILASASPRRKELLTNLHLPFEISSSNVDESFSPSLSPADAVVELASRKAKFVAEKNGDAYVIGADTIVVFEGDILGKPQDEEEAVSMLSRLSGSTHEVYTGVSIISPEKEISFYEKTLVTFWELTQEEISLYIKSGEPYDKAGSYGIQGFGSYLVKSVNGDYFTVVGLPVSRTARELQKLGYKFPSV